MNVRLRHIRSTREDTTISPGWSIGSSTVRMTRAEVRNGMNQPEGVVENERLKILWDMTIQCDHVVETRMPDIVVVEKESNEAIVVDIAVP